MQLHNGIDLRFSYYGPNPWEAVYLSELCACGINELPLIARVEDSGSEGFYVEVARWSDKLKGWARFAFYKFLGRNAHLEASEVCDQINGGRDYCLIHWLPDWQ